MKRNIFTAVVTAVTISSNVLAYAADNLTADYKYYANRNSVIISGTSGDTPVKPVDIMILKGNIEYSGNEAPDEMVDFRTGYTDTEGKYTIASKLSDKLEGGEYTVYITSSEGRERLVFIVINENESVFAVEKINKATDENEVKNIIISEANKFGLTNEKASENSSMIAAVVFANRPASGYKLASEIQNYAEIAIAINEIVSTDSYVELEGILRESAGVLNVSIDDYMASSDSVKEKLLPILKKSDYRHNSFNVIFANAMLLAKIQGASNWSALKTAVIEAKDYCGLDMSMASDYEKVKNKDNVYQKMFKKPLTDKSTIANSFNESVKEALAEQSKGAGNSSNSGGGSSGGGGGSSSGGGKLPGVIRDETTTDISKPVGAKGFSDVSGHWAENEINFLASRGIISGYDDNTFRPNNAVTRAEFVKLIVKGFDLTATGTISFKDVYDTDWFESYVKTAAQLKIVEGYDGYFNPNSTITRQDAAVIIYRLVDYIGITLQGDKAFSDSQDISDYASSAIGALGANEIINGIDGKFEPKASITRAQTSKMISNVFDFIEK